MTVRGEKCGWDSEVGVVVLGEIGKVTRPD
jgi:hypothetical protein